MTTNKLIGDNSHGFTNETLLINSLNNKQLKDLTPHLKKFITHICKEHNIHISNSDYIFSKSADREIDPETNKKINAKPDFYIEINKFSFGISTKMGNGNSVHQEKVESFINWLKNNNSIKVIDNNIFDDLRLLIWGDGTLDGTAPVVRDSKGFVEGRFTTKEFKNLYPDKWKKIQQFLDINKKEILKRALFLGKTSKAVHYIYYGTIKHGTWISQNDLLEFNLNNSFANSTFNVGRLSFQIYNSDKKGTPSGSKKRGDVQFKYGNLSKDIQLLMLKNSDNNGTFEGDIEEFNFSKMMNKNKKHSFWKFLSSKLNFTSTENYYVIKVVGKKYSKNSEKKVMCKTDNYIIKTTSPISKQLLLQNDYQLTEDNLSEIKNYTIIKESGISVKQKDSKNYTITKMTLSNFRSAFINYNENIDYFINSLVLYCNKKQVDKNIQIASDLKFEESDFINFFNTKYNLSITNLLDYESLSKLNLLVKKELQNIIDSNISLKESIFTGKHWFESPYYVNFIYSHGTLSDETFIPYNIDNGSGRSKGNYTIIIKPK